MKAFDVIRRKYYAKKVQELEGMGYVDIPTYRDSGKEESWIFDEGTEKQCVPLKKGLDDLIQSKTNKLRYVALCFIPEKAERIIISYLKTFDVRIKVTNGEKTVILNYKQNWR